MHNCMAQGWLSNSVALCSVENLNFCQVYAKKGQKIESVMIWTLLQWKCRFDV